MLTNMLNVLNSSTPTQYTITCIVFINILLFTATNTFYIIQKHLLFLTHVR